MTASAPASISERWRGLTPLGIADRLVGEVSDAALEGLGVEEAHGFLVAGLAEQALADPEGDREDLQPQLVDQVVLDQRAYELKLPAMTMSPSMCCFSVETSLSTSPLRTVELFQARLARVADTMYLGRLFSLSAGLPLRDGHRAASHLSSPTQKEGPGGQRLVERELGKLRAMSDQADPAAGPEAFVTGRVLDDSVERDVPAHDDLSRFSSAPRWSSANQTPAARPASPPCLEEQPVSFAGPPGVILDGFHEILVDDHGLPLLLIVVVSYRRRGQRGR